MRIFTVLFLVVLLFVLWVIFFPPSFGGQKVNIVNGEQKINIAVQSSYSPEKIVVKKDIPVRMQFKITDAAACSKIIVSSGFGIPVTELKDGQELLFTPKQTGSYSITCTHGMYYLMVRVTA